MNTEQAQTPTPTVHTVLGYRHPSGRWDCFIEGQHVFAHNPDLEPQLRADIERREMSMDRLAHVLDKIGNGTAEELHVQPHPSDHPDAVADLVGQLIAEYRVLLGHKDALLRVGAKLAVILDHDIDDNVALFEVIDQRLDELAENAGLNVVKTETVAELLETLR